MRLFNYLNPKNILFGGDNLDNTIINNNTTTNINSNNIQKAEEDTNQNNTNQETNNNTNQETNNNTNQETNNNTNQKNTNTNQEDIKQETNNNTNQEDIKQETNNNTNQEDIKQNNNIDNDSPIVYSEKLMTMLSYVLMGIIVFLLISTCINVITNKNLKKPQKSFYYLETLLMSIVYSIILSVLFIIRLKQKEKDYINLNIMKIVFYIGIFSFLVIFIINILLEFSGIYNYILDINNVNIKDKVCKNYENIFSKTMKIMLYIIFIYIMLYMCYTSINVSDTSYNNKSLLFECIVLLFVLLLPNMIIIFCRNINIDFSKLKIFFYFNIILLIIHINLQYSGLYNLMLNYIIE